MDNDEIKSDRVSIYKKTHHSAHSRRKKRKSVLIFIFRCLISLLLFAMASYLLFGSISDEGVDYNLVLSLFCYGGCIFVLLKRNKVYLISGSVFKKK